MSSVKFYKYKDTWRYKLIGQDAKDVDTFALESFLGVVGGPRVVMFRETERPPLVKLRVEVCHGFITRASTAESDDVPLNEGVEVEEFFVRPIMR
jgi:hypothetical protein